jgi:mono/diheme cytochrome c family protein
MAAASLLVVAMASAHGSATPTAAQLAAGKKVFIANCGKCHTLLQAKTHGAVGPNLNTLKLPNGRIVLQINGGGRFMPPFAVAQGGTLSPTQVSNVAAFVYKSEH